MRKQASLTSSIALIIQYDVSKIIKIIIKMIDSKAHKKKIFIVDYQ